MTQNPIDTKASQPAGDLTESSAKADAKPTVSRRQALLAAIFGGVAVFGKEVQAATVAGCECLPAPDCNAACPNGGVPKGDGTQGCDCIEIPQNVPPRALALVDGGDAVNATKWGGKTLRLNHNTTDTWIPVISGNNVDYVLKSEIGGAGQKIGAATLYGTDILVTTGSGNKSTSYTAVQRDDYGRVIKVGLWRYQFRCDCNCCNCGDDSACFICARLMTPEGFKDVSDLRVGDSVIGIDGVHKVVGIITGTLENRNAVNVVGHPETILTEEHVVLFNNIPTTGSVTEYKRNRRVLQAPNGVRGIYVNEDLDRLVNFKADAFVEVESHPDTVTYTPVVEGGCWALTEDGVSVLLCRAVKN